MDYIDRLRRLAINDSDLVEDTAGCDKDWLEPILDPRTLALVRLAALVAVGGAVPSYSAQADAAVDAGASAAEAVDVLVAVLPLVGRPRVVAAAPKLAMAMGYDTDDPEQQSAG
jgi:4-carboxymuconolactone decarboxylase